MAEITFGKTQKGKKKLFDGEGYSYVLKQYFKQKDVCYWTCSIKKCCGRFKYNRATGDGNISVAHNSKIEHPGPAWRARDAALEKLRELTLSVEGSVKAIEIVRTVVKDLPSEVCAIMPSERMLIDRVIRLAKSKNIELVKATRGDFHASEDQQNPSSGETGDSAFSTKEVTAPREVTSEKGVGRGRNSRSRVKTLKRVDEEGNEIGFASLEDFLLGPTNQKLQDCSTGVSGIGQRDEKFTPNTQPSTFENISANDDIEDEGDYMDDGGEDFQIDIEPEYEPISTQTPVRHKLSSTVITTSSKLPVRTKKPSSKHAAKSGERCFVCGDELIVSETLGASEGTFRTACRYLNVKSDGEWFPTIQNAKFYSFCESCTNEINRIHGLYQKIKEIQSLIFKKVESVEKRIADAEIVDNWMAEAPHSTAVRFEGFRKQVMINYRNKLKLRREIRFGEKTGQPLVEIQPATSVHMFAKDPSEMTFSSDVTPEHQADTATTTATEIRRTRGRPKSKQQKEKRQQEKIVEEAEEGQHEPDFTDGYANNYNDDDGSFLHDFDDSQDAMSVTSEKEVKFWEDDLSKLDVKRQRTKRTAKFQTAGAEDDDFDDGNEEMDNENDSDYEEDEEEDEDWGPAKKKRTKSSKTPENEFRKNWDSSPKKTTTPSGKIIIGVRKSSKPEGGNQAKPKVGEFKITQSKDMKFPDAVLTKDGRLFMEGVEIIKNPPGVYKPIPDSVSFSCGACGKVVPRFYHIRLHISGHHLGAFKCNICQKELADPKSLRKHIKMIHEDNSSCENCPICGKPVRNYSHNMKFHRWMHLSKEEKEDPQYKSWRPGRERDPNEVGACRQTFMCGQCGKTFKLPSVLRRHELMHNTESPSKVPSICQYCGKSYSDRSGLLRHVMRCENNAQGRINSSFPCPKCNKRFTSRSTRGKHIRRSHANSFTSSELPFSCTKCPRRFTTRAGFRIHKRVCIDGKPGNNTRRRTDQGPAEPASLSSASHAYSDFKADPSDVPVSPPGHTQSQGRGHYSSLEASSSDMPYYSNNAATALGFNYKFT